MFDIPALVRRIGDVLGPDASPSQVEAVAAAVLALNANGASHAGAPSPLAGTSAAFHPEPGERVIITAYGADRPGVLAAITGVVSDAGCNILDVSQKILQGYFTLIMLADIAPMRISLSDLQRRLAETGERLGVRVLAQHEDLFNAMHRV